jgi:hypothetical protein
MYVIIQPDSGRILAFGATPKKAMADFVRRDIWVDGPPLETHRCSPALYRLLKAKAKDVTTLARCKINSKGVAVRPNRGPTVISIRIGQPCT